MDYSKYLLNKEHIELGEVETLTQVFEMLSNQQELKNVVKKALSTLHDVEGEISLVQFRQDKIHLINHRGEKAKVDLYLENKKALKQVKDTRKPYFSSSAEVAEPNYFAILPILAKDELLGALCIHTEQQISCWKEIYVFLHLMSMSLKYYNLIDSTKYANTKDVVTSLYNYRHFQDQLDLEIEKHVRHYIPVSLLMVDICDFKTINEKLGYDGGDQVLCQVAEWIEDQCRRIDMPVRLEGDTFAVLLSNTNIGGAEALLRRILMKVEHNTLNIQGKEFKIQIKTSITAYEQHLSKDEFVSKAKENLQ